MQRTNGLARARSVTYGLAGISLIGTAAVAGVAHATTEAQRSAHQNRTPATTTPTPPPPHSVSAQPQAPANDRRTPKPTPTPKPRHTTAPPKATSGGS